MSIRLTEITDLIKEKESELTAAAAKARKEAFSPFSGSKVGVAVLVYDGTIFTGANVEFTRSTNVHAEWIASDKAVKYIQTSLNLSRKQLQQKMKDGLEEYVAIAEANNDAVPGCGPCRQMIMEINPHAWFYGLYADGEIASKKTVSDLYPDEYRSNNGIKL